MHEILIRWSCDFDISCLMQSLTLHIAKLRVAVLADWRLGILKLRYKKQTISAKNLRIYSCRRIKTDFDCRLLLQKWSVKVVVKLSLFVSSILLAEVSTSAIIFASLLKSKESQSIMLLLLHIATCRHITAVNRTCIAVMISARSGFKRL